MENVTGAHNQKYFNGWSDLLNNSPLRHYYQYVAVKYEPSFMAHGYSLIEGFGLAEERRRDAERISPTTGALYCAMANVHALMMRLPIRTKAYIKKQLRAHLPEPVKLRIKNLVHKVEPDKKQLEVVSS